MTSVCIFQHIFAISVSYSEHRLKRFVFCTIVIEVQKSIAFPNRVKSRSTKVKRILSKSGLCLQFSKVVVISGMGKCITQQQGVLKE